MQGKIEMHARSVHTRSGLRHESRVQSVLARYRSDRQTESLNIIRRLQRLIIVKIHFMLGGSTLVVARLDLEPHVLQREHDIAPRVLSEIDRTQVEVSCHLPGIRRRISFVVRLEQEELALGPDIEEIAVPCCILNRFLQNIS